MRRKLILVGGGEILSLRKYRKEAGTKTCLLKTSERGSEA